MRAKFEQFLEDNGALQAYNAGRKFNQSTRYEDLDYNVFRPEVSPDRWLRRSFVFVNTPEGERYWDQLDERWSEVCRKERIKAAFVSFLTEHGCYTDFMRNLAYAENYNGDTFPECSFDVLVEETPNPENWITEAFWWEPTEDGHEFWEALAEVWQEVLDEIL